MSSALSSSLSLQVSKLVAQAVDNVSNRLTISTNCINIVQKFISALLYFSKVLNILSLVQKTLDLIM